MKKCNKCQKIKPLTEFFKDKASSDGYYTICKKCKSDSTYKWRKENKELYNNGAKKWRKNNPEKEYGHEIKRRYGLSLEDYNKMLVKQEMKCALCDTQHDPTKKRGRLYVDHCHKTGQIRALLCSAHNCMLGYANDDVEILQRAVDYVNKHNKEK